MFRQIASIVNRMYQSYMPGFWLRLKPRYQWAGGIAILVMLYVATGLFQPHAAPKDVDEITSPTVPRVSVAVLEAAERDATVTIRGKTQTQPDSKSHSCTQGSGVNHRGSNELIEVFVLHSDCVHVSSGVKDNLILPRQRGAEIRSRSAPRVVEV